MVDYPKCKKDLKDSKIANQLGTIFIAYFDDSRKDFPIYRFFRLWMFRYPILKAVYLPLYPVVLLKRKNK